VDLCALLECQDFDTVADEVLADAINCATSPTPLVRERFSETLISPLPQVQHQVLQVSLSQVAG
jgi:hypothetical protein